MSSSSDRVRDAHERMTLQGDHYSVVVRGEDQTPTLAEVER